MQTIRPLQATDFVALAHYQNTWSPEEPPVTPEMLQEKEAAAVRERCTGLVVALQAETIVATVRYVEARGQEDAPGAYWLYFASLPTVRTVALFTELYRGVLANLSPYHPTSLQGMAREDDLALVAFYQQGHFQEKLRSFGANLDLATFDPTIYADGAGRLKALGIEIKCYADLAGDPARDRKLYDLLQETMAEMPNLGQFDAQSFAQFVNDYLHDSAMLPDAYFVATHGDAYVGVSELFAGAEPGVFDTKSTGVRQSYRRYGIALALKVRALTYAKTHGGIRVTTGMAATNTPIVTLNRRLGFVPEPMWITFVQRLP